MLARICSSSPVRWVNLPTPVTAYEMLPGRFFDVRDPSGNRVQIVQYDEIQFTKTDRVLAGMGLELGKSEQALEELRAQNLAD